MLLSTGPGKGLTEVEVMSASTLIGPEVEYADRPGRNSAAPGMAQHAFAEPQAVHDRERDIFSRAVLAEAEAQFTEGRYHRFALVAAPDMLGALRAALPKVLKEAMVLDLAKDFLKLTPAEVVDHLAPKLKL
jgi:protein required for attachment to host cells